MDILSVTVNICYLLVICFGYISAGCRENGLLMKDPSTPCKYLQCVHGKTISRKCPSGLGVQPVFVSGNRNPCVMNYDECKDKDAPMRVINAQIKLQRLMPVQKFNVKPTRKDEIKTNNINLIKPNMRSRPPINNINNKNNNVILSNKKPPKSQDRKHLKQLFMSEFADNGYQQTIMFPPPETNFQPIHPNPQMDYSVDNFDFTKNPNNNFDSEFNTFLQQVSNNNGDGQSYFNNNGGNTDFSPPKFDENQFAQTVLQHNEGSNFNYPSPPMQFNVPIDHNRNLQPNNIQQYQVDNTQFNSQPSPYIAVQQQTYQQPAQQYNIQPAVNHQQNFQSSVQYQDFTANKDNNFQSSQQQHAGVHFNLQNFQNPTNSHNVVHSPLQQTHALFQAHNMNNVPQDTISNGYPKTNIAVSIPVDAFQNMQHSHQQQQQQVNLLQHMIPQPTLPTGPSYQIQSQITNTPDVQIPSGYGNVQTGKAVTREQKQEALAKLIPYILQLPQQSQTSRLTQQNRAGQGQKKLLLAKILQRLIKALKKGKITRLNKNVNLPRIKLQQLGQILKRKQTSLRQQPQRRRKIQRGRRRRRKQFRGRGRRRNRQGIMGKMAKGQGFQINRSDDRNTERNNQGDNIASVQNQEYDYNNEVDYQTEDGATDTPDYDYNDETSTQEPTYDYDNSDTTNNEEKGDYDDDVTENEDEIQYSNSGTNAPETADSKFRHMRDGIRIPISPKEGTRTYVNNNPQQQSLYGNAPKQVQAFLPQQQQFGNRANLQQQELNRADVSSPSQQEVLSRAGLTLYRPQITGQNGQNQQNRFSSENSQQLNRPSGNIPNRPSISPLFANSNQFRNPLQSDVNVGNNQFTTAVNKQTNAQGPKYQFSTNQGPVNQISKFGVSFNDGSQQTKISSSQFNGNQDNSNSRRKLSTLSIDQNIELDQNSDGIDPSLFDEMPLEYLQLLQEFAIEYIDNLSGSNSVENNEISTADNVPKYKASTDGRVQNVPRYTENEAQPRINTFVPIPTPTSNKQLSPSTAGDSFPKTGLEVIENISTLPPIETNKDVVKINTADLKSNDLFVRNNAGSISNNENNNNALVQNSEIQREKHNAPIQNSTVQNKNPAYTAEKSAPPGNGINFVDASVPNKLDDESQFEVENGVKDKIIKEDIAFQQALTYYSKLLHSLSDFVSDGENEFGDVSNNKNKYKHYLNQDTATKFDENEYQSSYYST